MKRGITLLILLVLLISPTIIATENSSDEIKKQLSTLKGGLDEKTENILKREIQMPDLLETSIKVMFGLKKETPITIEKFIILIAIWIVLFILIREIFKLTPFFNKGTQNIVGSAIVTIIIALTGAINSLMIFFFDLGKIFEWMKALGPFQIFITLAIVALIFFVGHSILKILRKKLKLEKAETSGENIGYLASIAKITKKAIEK